MASAWFTMVMGEVSGPFAARQLLSMARGGELRIDDWVRRDEDGDWVRAENVIGLFDVPSLSVVIKQSVAVIDGLAPASNGDTVTMQSDPSRTTIVSADFVGAQFDEQDRPRAMAMTVREFSNGGHESRRTVVIPRRTMTRAR